MTNIKKNWKFELQEDGNGWELKSYKGAMTDQEAKAEALRLLRGEIVDVRKARKNGREVASINIDDPDNDVIYASAGELLIEDVDYYTVELKNYTQVLVMGFAEESAITAEELYWDKRKGIVDAMGNIATRELTEEEKQMLEEERGY